jgi:PAS domain S-box-containing protein
MAGLYASSDEESSCMQTSSFEVYVLGLLAVLERLPMPIAIAFDRECERIQGNRAFRRLSGLSTAENASLGVRRERRMPRYHAIIAGTEVVPEQMPMHRAAREGTEVVDVGMQLVRHDGRKFDLIASAWPLRDSDGAVQGSIGVFIDVTQSKEAEQRAQQAMEALSESERRYRLITEAMPEFVWLDARDGSALYSNKRWLEYTGLSEEQNAGFGWQSVVHPDDGKRLQTQRERTLHTGEPYEGECRYRGKDGKYRWFLFRSIPVRDEHGNITSWLGTATDIDKQKRAEAQQAFFALASDVLGSTLDVATTLDRIARLAVASMGTWCQIDIPDAHGRLRVGVVAHQDAGKEALLSGLLNHHIYNDRADIGPPAVLTKVKPQLLTHVEEAAVEYVIPNAHYREIYREVGYAAGVIVPLRIRDRVLGVLGIASDDPTRLYTEFDVSTALELGRRGAIALENAQSFAREHRVATTLQRALLPASLPETASVQFDSAYASAASAQGEAVGGDWYDAFTLDEGRIAISVGDVTGHGVDAAVTMSAVRQAIRAAALDRRSPKEILARANATLMLEHRAPMITAVFAIYDTVERELHYAIAGHPRPLIVGESGELTELHGTGTPLGDIFEASSLEEQHIALGDGPAAIVFYTDGLVEYRRDILGGLERLERVVRARTFLDAEEPAQAVIDAVLDGHQVDDVAVLVMRISSAAATP